MGQLNTFRVTGCARGIAEDVYIVLVSLDEGWCILGRLHDRAEGANIDAEFLGLLKESWLDVFGSDQSLQVLSLTLLAKSDELGSVVLRADKSLHLSLVEDELDLFERHGIVEANSRDLVVHAGKHRGRPLPSVLGPDTTEAPLFTLSLDFWAEIERHEALCKVLSTCANLSKSLPLVWTEHRLAILSFSCKKWARAKEFLLRIHAHILAESADDGMLSFFIVRDEVEFVVVLFIDLHANKLSRVALTWFFVHSPSGVLNVTLNAVSGAVCFDHGLMLSRFFFKSCKQ